MNTPVTPPTRLSPFETARRFIESLGQKMTLDEWIDFLTDVEDDVHAKRETAQQELRDEEGTA